MLTQLATLMNVDAFMNKVEEISANPDPFVILFSLVFISNNCNDHQNKKNLFISPILPPAKTAKTRKSVLYLRLSFKKLSIFLT